MPNQRDPRKKQVKVWMTDKEKAELEKRAKDLGYSTLTDFLRDVARGIVKLWILGWIIASLFRWTQVPFMEALAQGGLDMLALTWQAAAFSCAGFCEIIAALASL